MRLGEELRSKNMKQMMLIAALALTGLAFDAKDEPPPPPPVGHMVYCLTRDEVTDALKLWLKEKKLPITGKVTFEETVKFSTISNLYIGNACSPTPTPSPEPYLKIKVEYKK